ncbi:hypothetical protein JCM10207_005183 [Rhodosporidiobolus poonsookiae]
MASLLQDLQLKLQDPSIPWDKVLLGSIGTVALFEEWLGSRQRPYLSSLLHPQLPSALRPYLTAPDTAQTYSKSQAYARSKLNYSLAATVIDLVESFVLLTPVALPLWTAAGLPYTGSERWTLLRGLWDLSGQLPGARKGEISHSMAFVALMTAVGAVLSIPKDLYKNFVLEQKHGFNKMTLSTFWKDQVKGLAISLALEVPLIGGLIKIIHWAGQDAILRIVAWTILFIFCIQLIMVPLYPAVIQPLFNTFTPLPDDSPVRPRVKALAEKLNFPLGKIWVINGSLRSSHSNAYFYGLPGLHKNIVIYDTLIDKSSPEEVEAILAHELGHWYHGDIAYLLVTALLQLAFSLTIYSIFLTNGPLLRAFGFSPSSPLLSKLAHPTSSTSTSHGPTIIALLLASLLAAPLSAFLKFATNTVTRALEYRADAFAVRCGGETAKNLKGALVGIHEKNLAVYGVDPIYSAYNHNHPTLLERLEALDKGIAKLGGGAEREGKKEK